MYRFVILDYFKKQLKRFVKKDRTLKENIIEALKNFEKGSGISLGKKLYKMRIGKDGGGKSGGYRMILVVREIESLLVPICIYAKADRDNITMEEMAWHLKKAEAELKYF